MVPIGRGQRELIIGDRKIGKTAIAVDAIINQRDSEVVCVYCAIGQKTSTVNRVVDTIARLGPKARTIVVVAEAAGPPGLAWIAPYAACTMAEYFSERGDDALLVLDDLTKHAAIHREVSLLLRRPPGREAYPGDVFYAHSRLLERGAHLSPERGGGSLTILPIAETLAGNLTAYIPTNLISITDGQIILDPKLFNEGQKPAVNVGLSVSRVGAKAQAPALKDLAGSLRLSYAQFLELEIFTRFGGMADERTRRLVDHGKRLRRMLVQANARPRPLAEQVAGLLAVHEGLLDALPRPAVDAFKERLAAELGAACPEAVDHIRASGRLADDQRAALLGSLRRIVGGGA
jgi:F-type H+-transporting ATPase subunit alpha